MPSSSTLRFAAVHLGEDHHLIDHIAPLCDALQMPLFVSEESDHFQHYYPQIQTVFWPDLDISWGKIAEEANVLFRCRYWPPHFQQMIQEIHGQKLHLVFCPHGQSDKGLSSDVLLPYRDQEIVLIYGSLMQEMLQERQIWPGIKKWAVLGNPRLAFYQKYQKFFDRLVDQEIFSKLDPQKKTMIYAPTWLDLEESCSFFSMTRQLIQEVPPHWNLIIKPHPWIENRYPEEFYSIVHAADEKSNILWLDDFPLIYPLLNRVDVYLGDGSSIGYDVLFFQRPMFFFPTPRLQPLHRCGLTIDTKAPFPFIEKNISSMQGFKPLQEKLYKHTFSEIPDLKKEILKLLATAEGRQDKNGM